MCIEIEEHLLIASLLILGVDKDTCKERHGIGFKASLLVCQYPLYIRVCLHVLMGSPAFRFPHLWINFIYLSRKNALEMAQVLKIMFGTFS